MSNAKNKKQTLCTIYVFAHPMHLSSVSVSATRDFWPVGGGAGHWPSRLWPVPGERKPGAARTTPLDLGCDTVPRGAPCCDCVTLAKKEVTTSLEFLVPRFLPFETRVRAGVPPSRHRQTRSMTIEKHVRRTKTLILLRGFKIN